MDCWAGGSCWVHECTGEPGGDNLDVGAAWELLRATPTDELEAIVVAHPGRFSLNLERDALQLEDCRGEVVAHIPLGAHKQLAAVH